VLVNYTDDGRESMAFLVDCAAWSNSCMLLGRLSLAWLLEGPTAVGGAAGGGGGSGGAGCKSAGADVASCRAEAQATGQAAPKMVADLLADFQAGAGLVVSLPTGGKQKGGAGAAGAPRAGGVWAALGGWLLVVMMTMMGEDPLWF